MRHVGVSLGVAPGVICVFIVTFVVLLQSLPAVGHTLLYFIHQPAVGVLERKGARLSCPGTRLVNSNTEIMSDQIRGSQDVADARSLCSGLHARKESKFRAPLIDSFYAWKPPILVP